MRKKHTPILLLPFSIVPTCEPICSGREPVELQRNGNQIGILIGGRPFTTYYFDPKTEQVLGEEEANNLLHDGDRGYRTPFVVPKKSNKEKT